MKRVWIWMLLLTLMLVPVQAAQPDVEITWNATHTRLDIRGDLGTAQYGILGLFQADGKMLYSRPCTAGEVAEGITVASTDFAQATARLFFLNENLQPVEVPQQAAQPAPDAPQEGAFLCWLYATDLGFIDSVDESGLANGGKLLFSDGQRQQVLPAKGTGLSKLDLGRPFCIQYDPDTGEILWIQALDIAVEAVGAVWQMDSRDTGDEFRFTLGGLVDAPLNGETVPCLTLTHDEDAPRQISAEELHTLIQQGMGNTDIYSLMDREGDGDIDYLLHIPVSYGVVTKVDVSEKFGPYIRITDWQGQELKNLYSRSSRNLYLEDDCRFDEQVQPGDIVRFYIDPLGGYRQVDVLPQSTGVLCNGTDTELGLTVMDGGLYFLAQKAFGELPQAGGIYTMASDGFFLVWTNTEMP